MTNDEMIAVLIADKEGKEIQARSLNANSVIWKDMMNSPGWFFGDFDYRVKPVEPIITLLDIHTYADSCDCIPAGSVPNALKGNHTDWVRARVNFIELTDEVRATLTEKGILKC